MWRARERPRFTADHRPIGHATGTLPVGLCARLPGPGTRAGHSRLDNHSMEDEETPLACERLAAFLEDEGHAPAS
jgi:hypothetical protein